MRLISTSDNVGEQGRGEQREVEEITWRIRGDEISEMWSSQYCEVERGGVMGEGLVGWGSSRRTALLEEMLWRLSSPCGNLLSRHHRSISQHYVSPISFLPHDPGDLEQNPKMLNSV